MTEEEDLSKCEVGEVDKMSESVGEMRLRKRLEKKERGSVELVRNHG